MPRRTISLFHRIEKAMETIALGETPLDTVRQTADFLVRTFADDLGIRGGRIYSRQDGAYELVATFGQVEKAPVGLVVDRSYAPIAHVLEVGAVVMRREDPRLDPGLEDDLGTATEFVAISVGDGAYVLSFDLVLPDHEHETLVSTLNIVRLAINQKLREERMVAAMEDARLIQTSILPRRVPNLGGYLMAAASQPAEIVGGDFWDVILLERGHFDVVVADATGHGLPAALQVRDVFTGLRMGLTREYKIDRTLERLNRIIHRSRLTTRFVSLFLVEIARDGALTYASAGHPPALLVRADGQVDRLHTSGLVLGPFPNARIRIGIDTIERDDLLVLYTDGITEALAPDDETEYGIDRLQKLVVTERSRHPQTIIDRVLADVNAFSGTDAPEDDRTIVVVKRTARSREGA
jgi:sigma-B regulation protein RsbU (phosphoserine phosphatase)